MKKIGFILGLVVLAGTSSYACDHKKDGCCKDAKEVAKETTKEAASCNKEKSCCKKEGKTTKASKSKKAEKQQTSTAVETKS